jgi:hypothetical protein
LCGIRRPLATDQDIPSPQPAPQAHTVGEPADPNIAHNDEKENSRKPNGE